MKLPVSDRHHAGQDECDGPGEETEHDRDAAEEFEHSTDTRLGHQGRRARLARHAAEPAEQDQTASLEEQKTRHDAKQKVRDLYCSVHAYLLLILPPIEPLKRLCRSSAYPRSPGAHPPPVRAEIPAPALAADAL